jgi:predicted Zn-dependent protease
MDQVIMTPEKQRIAIAKACEKSPRASTAASAWTTISLRSPKWWASIEVPDYLNDLNAMHEAEGMLLAKCGNDPQDDLWVDYLANLLMAAPLCLREHATAAQRAEAFLRTIGKWEESK